MRARRPDLGFSGRRGGARWPLGLLSAAAILVGAGCGSSHSLTRDLRDTTVVYLPSMKGPGGASKAVPIVYTTVEGSPHLSSEGTLARKLDDKEMDFLLDALVGAGLEAVPEAPVAGGAPGPQSITIESGGASRRWEGRSSAVLNDVEAKMAFTRSVLVLIQHARSDYKTGVRRR